MPPDRTCLLLSIKPSFAEAIFAGHKRIELRRTRPKLQPGDLVLVYVTAPHKELRGLLRVVRVAEADPEVFWSEVSEVAGIGKDHFDEYFTGARSAFGIHFDEVHSFARPLGAEEVRQNGWPCFQPPQAYRYLRSSEIKSLEVLLEAGLWDHVTPSRLGI